MTSWEILEVEEHTMFTKARIAFAIAVLIPGALIAGVSLKKSQQRMPAFKVKKSSKNSKEGLIDLKLSQKAERRKLKKEKSTRRGLIDLIL